MSASSPQGRSTVVFSHLPLTERGRVRAACKRHGENNNNEGERTAVDSGSDTDRHGPVANASRCARSKIRTPFFRPNKFAVHGGRRRCYRRGWMVKPPHDRHGKY